MAAMKIPILVSDVLQPDGQIYSDEDLEFMAQSDARFKFEPENKTLFAIIEE